MDGYWYYFHKSSCNGTYIVQVQVNANDGTGTMYNCYSSGVMSWYKDGTNDTETDEIILHRSGHLYGKQST